MNEKYSCSDIKKAVSRKTSSPKQHQEMKNMKIN